MAPPGLAKRHPARPSEEQAAATRTLDDLHAWRVRHLLLLRRAGVGLEIGGTKMELRVRFVALLLAAAGCASGTLPAHAQVDGTHVAITPFAGVTRWDRRTGLEPGGLLGVRGALAILPHLNLEATYGVVLTEESAPPQVDSRVKQLGADLVLDILPRRRLVPYLVAGWSQLVFDPGAGETQTRDAWQAGGGLRVWVAPRVGLRLDMRDVLCRRDAASPASNSFDHNLFVGAGLYLAAGGRVRSGADLAQKNAAINQTLTRMYHSGLDADCDGVFDEDDRCADTPKGAQVDPGGCPGDADDDGVFDGLDLCPHTPVEVRVDAYGCPIEIREKEIQLLEEGSLCLGDIQFEPGRTQLQPGSFGDLNDVGQILQDWPLLQIEIGGHTDSWGSSASNLALSQRRAGAVRDYLLKAFPQIEASRLLAVGYGEGRSVARNGTEVGRTMNRRVEFKVINREALRKERQTRRYLTKGEE